jgi:RNA polymerase sigma factor (sigma-70 family)
MLFEEHRARIQRYVRGMVRDQAEAEDLTQETFLRAFRNRESLRDPAAVSTWLYRIATHVCYDRFRQRSKQPLADRPPDEPRTDEPAAPRLDKLFEQAEMSGCVQQFIGALPDTYRRALLLHDVHGLTAPEIARVRQLGRGGEDPPAPRPPPAGGGALGRLRSLARRARRAHLRAEAPALTHVETRSSLRRGPPREK